MLEINFFKKIFNEYPQFKRDWIHIQQNAHPGFDPNYI